MTHRSGTATPTGDPADAYTALAGLFVGDGIVDDDLIGVLLDPSQDRDDALLALASGRRAEAAGRIDQAVRDFQHAVVTAEDAGAGEIAAHAAHDCARALFTRNAFGDKEACRAMLVRAHDHAAARGMTKLRERIEDLELGLDQG